MEEFPTNRNNEKRQAHQREDMYRLFAKQDNELFPRQLSNNLANLTIHPTFAVQMITSNTIHHHLNLPLR
jgi:hypothetical protein